MSSRVFSGVCVEALGAMMWTPDSWNHNKDAVVRESQEVNRTWPGEGMETQLRTVSFATHNSIIHSLGRTDIWGDNKKSKLR